MPLSEDVNQQETTRHKILIAAEKMFIDKGYKGTSIRNLSRVANVNLAAVNYHFESKRGLLQALINHHLKRVNQRRVELLDQLEANPPLRAGQILMAFFDPLFEPDPGSKNNDSTFLRLLGKTLSESQDFVYALMPERYRDVTHRFIEAFMASIPGLSREECVWRFNFMLGAMSYALVGPDAVRRSFGFLREETPSDATAHLQARFNCFVIGALRAPLPDFSSKK